MQATNLLLMWPSDCMQNTLPSSLSSLLSGNAAEVSILGFQGTDGTLQHTVTTSVLRSLPGYVIAGIIRMYQHVITYKRLQGAPLSSARVQETCELALAAVSGCMEAYEQKLLTARQQLQAIESLFREAAAALNSDPCWQSCAAGHAASSRSPKSLEPQADAGSAAAGSSATATPSAGDFGSDSHSIEAASAAAEAQKPPDKSPSIATGVQEPQQDTAPQVDQDVPSCPPCSSSGSDPSNSSLAWLGLLAALSGLQQYWLELAAEAVAVKRDLAAYDYSFAALQADIERLNKLKRSWERLVAGEEVESDPADYEGPGGDLGDEGSSGAADTGATDGEDEGSGQGDD